MRFGCLNAKDRPEDAGDRVQIVRLGAFVLSGFFSTLKGLMGGISSGIKKIRFQGAKAAAPGNAAKTAIWGILPLSTIIIYYYGY